MVDCQKNAHAVWDAKQRAIWAAKRSYKVLRGEIAVRTRDLPRQMCQGREATIVQGSVSPDRVHMLVSVPPQLAAAELAQCMKGRSSRILQDEHPQLRKALLGPTPLGARIFLRVRRRGGRGDDSAARRKPARRRKSRCGRSCEPRPAAPCTRCARRSSSRPTFRRLQPQTGDFQSPHNLSAFSRQLFSPPAAGWKSISAEETGESLRCTLYA